MDLEVVIQKKLLENHCSMVKSEEPERFLKVKNCLKDVFLEPEFLKFLVIVRLWIIMLSVSIRNYILVIFLI